MNCPICRALYERVELRFGTRSAVVIRCPECEPGAVDYAGLFGELYGNGTVEVKQANTGEALAALVRRIPDTEEAQRAAGLLLASFSAHCWMMVLDGTDPESRVGRREELARALCAELGKLIGEGVPL